MLPDSLGMLQETNSDIQIVGYSAPSIEENLALDEELAKNAHVYNRRTLRLWWGGSPTVVLGCTDKPETAVNIEACNALGIGIVKRVTGGGTVLQTAGVLNYSYTAPDPKKLDIHDLFGQGAEFVINGLSRLGIQACYRRISDVAVGDRKISGNAQARKWGSILLHGTILVDMDMNLLESILKHPSKEPEYRQGRQHKDFIITLRDLGIDVPDTEIERTFLQAAEKAFR